VSRPARKPAAKARRKAKPQPLHLRIGAVVRRVVRWTVGGLLVAVALIVLWVAAYRWIDPPTTPYMAAEAARLGGVQRVWVDIEDVPPALPRSLVAAEDANFCLHWGFDVDAIRTAIEEGSRRGASTISQQVVKNAFLWQGRSWPRKAAEAALTPVMEALWPKRRILEVYMNVAETAEGAFGVEAGARHHFGVSAADLSPAQAARLAGVLPSPKTRDAARPTDAQARRARVIADGAATIAADGRAGCFDG
jgi:monofunctional biosynthetic peptidoglycan transglycosylase